MLILLPPSEGKTPPPRGRPLDLGTLSHPELGPTRERVLAALVELCAGPPGPALEALGLSPGQAGELGLNAGLDARADGARPRGSTPASSTSGCGCASCPSGRATAC